jgi:hypothetical protein
VQSLAVSGALALVEPGDTGQLTATATFADGTTKDVTAGAAWVAAADRPVVLVSSTGAVTALWYGTSEISVAYGSVRHAISVRVAPPGTFLIAGKVASGGRPVSQALVEAACASGTYRTLTDSAGTFVLPGAGAVRLVVSMFGYEPAERHLAIGRDDQLSLELTTNGKAESLLGNYTLTVFASPSCDLPSEAVRRTFSAAIHHDARNGFIVTLGGADLVVSDPWSGVRGFRGEANADSVIFSISGNPDDWYAFVERVQGQTLAYDGVATAAIGSEAVVAQFEGSVTLRSADSTVARCSAADHRLEFRR